MKKILLVAILAIFLLNLYAVSAAEKVELYMFYGAGCPHCAAMEPFIDGLSEKYPDLEIKKFEVYFNDSNRKLFEQLAGACNSTVQGVPTVFIDDKMIVGYSSKTTQQIESEIKRCISEGCISPIEQIACKENATAVTGPTSPMVGETKITIPTLIGAAAVDAINPCTLAVLTLLLTTILLAGRKWRVLGAGLAFTTAVYISYFMMGMGIYSAVQISGVAHIFFYAVVIVTLVVGLLSIKDWFAYKPGALAVEIPLRWRPLAQSLIKSVASVPGAAAAGFFCSLFLLPCSSGPYLVILGLLAKETTRAGAIPLLILYNFIFVLPMIAITILVYAGLADTEKLRLWREKHVKEIHLISGIIMLGLAGLLVLSMWLGWV